jgi:hypothetical protein
MAATSPLRVEDPTTPRSALIVAHPGHELLLHHWLERARPIVCSLTDGSGSQAEDRSGRSRLIIERTGARIGPVFGARNDRDWYRAILEGDAELFQSTATRIADMCRAEGVTQIVADPVELFNPMHDLCSSIAQHVAMELRRDAVVELLTYPIERPDLMQRPLVSEHALDDEALQRKLDAAAEYCELSSEVERRRGVENLSIERLFAVDIDHVWSRHPLEEPHYEKVGRDRIARGSYGELITYTKHVRPLAVGLTGSAAPV